MTEWKGYGPDNAVPSGAGIAEPGPQAAIGAEALTYELHYGLKTKPFSLSTDPRSLYTTPSHAEALHDVLAAIRRREGIVVVTGEMGTGKTTLCRAALYQLDRKTFTTFVPDPFLSREDLLRMLLVDFGEVTIEDLRKGGLSGATRPELSYQLYEFLTSLESVDAFAVLVIDEAQHLGSPLLEEIRALSELEAGRRLLQIVLIGQPELEAHLKQPHMRQIDQRVTARCELKTFSRDDITGYVSHRLALAGARPERVSFSPAALDLVYRASAGIPRVVNLLCDRALSRGHLEQVSVIGPPLVTKAMEDLRLVAAPALTEGRTNEAKVGRLASTLLDEARPAVYARARVQPRSDTPPVAASELTALLNLAPTRRNEAELSSESASLSFTPTPSWKSRVEAERNKKSARFRFLRMLGLPLIGMGVMLIAGGIALKAQRARTDAQITAHPIAVSSLMQSPRTVGHRGPAPIGRTEGGPHVDEGAAVTPATQDGSWLVQVGAFADADRATALVSHLSEAGLPAYQVTAESGARALHIVRVGPFQTADEAGNVRARMLQTPDLGSTFVRNSER